MHRFKNRALLTQVRTRHKPQTTHECRAQVRQNIAVQIRRKDHVVLPRVQHQLHTGVVDDVFSVSNLGKSGGNLFATTQEKPIRQLHNIGFVDSVNLLAAMLFRIIKRRLRNPRRPLPRDDLERLRNVRIDHHLQPRIQVLGVLAKNDQVNIRVVRLEPRQRLHRPEIRVEVKLLTHRHVNRREAATHRRRRRPLQRNAILFNRFVKRLRNQLTVLGEGVRARLKAMPIERTAERCAGGFQNAHGRRSYFRADAVSGDECDFVRAGRGWQGSPLRG